MKKCIKCGLTTDRYYSNRHSKCIDCYKINRKPKQLDLVSKLRRESTRFILKGRGYSNLIGCDHEKVRSHIEKYFSDGMNWGSYGFWHIGHVVPLNSARTELQLRKLLNYKNIRPVWREVNLGRYENKR